MYIFYLFTTLIFTCLPLQNEASEINCKKTSAGSYPCKTNPKLMLECLTESLLSKKQSPQKNKSTQSTKERIEELSKLINEDIMPSLDIEHMAVHVIGRYNWKISSEQDKETFKKLFQEIVTNEYSKFINKINKKNLIKYYPTRGKIKSSTAVYGVLQEKDKKITVGFYMNCNEEKKSKIKSWQIYDLTLDNISYLDNYRLQFSATVRNAGLKGLNKKLKEITQAQLKKIYKKA